MARFAVSLLVASTLLGVATGGLLRPCDCSPRGLAAAADAPTHPCCRRSEAPERGRVPDGTALRLCRKGPPPGEEPKPGPAVAPPVTALHTQPVATALPGSARSSSRGLEVASPARPAWRLAPDGLSRFVI